MNHLGIVLSGDDLVGVDWPELLYSLGLNTLGMHSLLDPPPGFREKLERRKISFEYEIHSGSALLDRALFSTHQEYFPQWLRSGRTGAYNFCPSSAEGMEIVKLNAVSLMRRHPNSAHRYFFWGDDGKPWCHCRKCASYSMSDLQLLVANRIAEALEQVDPMAQVAYLAYCEMLDAPVRIKPRANVFLELSR